MDLKQLKAALDAAKEALDAKPEDKDLKAKYQAAKSAYEAALAAAEDEDDEDDDSDEDESEDSSKKKKKKASASGKQGDDEDDEEEENLGDMLRDPKKTESYIKSLRKENAKYRTKGKNLEERISRFEKGLKILTGGEDDDKLSTEEKLEVASQRSQVLAFEKTILEKAIENGITGKEGRELFEFYVTKAANDLEEGEELSDEDIAQVATKVRKLTGGNGKGARTSVDGSGGNPDGNSEVTLDQFVAMTISQKSALHAKSPDLYNRLFKEAVAKRRL